ncbi:MAG: HEAT repeat domain-containing protein, partial [Sedimentisphaerales bacterium]
MSSVKTLLVLITALSILLCAGCRKKPVQQPKPVSETKTTQPAKPQAEQPAPKTQNEQTTVPPKTTALPAVGDMNQPARGQKPQRKEFSQLAKERPGLTPPPKTNVISETETPVELNLNQFSSLASPEDKTEWISNFAEAHPDQIAAMAETAISDSNAEVSSAALDAVIENETPAPAAVEKAMKDADEEVREKAVEACKFIDDKQAGDILTKAINDQSESVRAMALQTAEEKSVDTKLKVFAEAITGKYEDVKEAAVPALVDMSSPQAVDTLIEGLKDTNADFRNDVTQALDFLISHECTGYG